MKKLIFVNQKGGSGKSILSYNMAFYLADQGKRVLFIDGDEQANSSSSLAKYTFSHLGASLLFSDMPIVLPVDNAPMVVLRGDTGLVQIEKSNRDDAEMVEVVRTRLAEIAGTFDVAVIDTPGANSRVANALLVASDYAAVPCKIDPYSIDVAGEMLKRIAFIQSNWSPTLTNLGILVNEYDPRQPEQVKGLKQLLGNFSSAMIPAYVSDRSAYREASGEGMPVWNLPKTAAREAGHEIKAVFKILLERMGGI